jgi:hypothetical protein
MSRSAAGAVLLIGVYGSGKTAVAEEIGTVMEERRTPYAALDLDWLAWFDAGWDDDAAEYQMMLKNLEAVVGNYLTAEIPFFVLALSIEAQVETGSHQGGAADATQGGPLDGSLGDDPGTAQLGRDDREAVRPPLGGRVAE